MKKKLKINRALWIHLAVALLFFGIAVWFFSPFIVGKLGFIWDTRDFGFIYLRMVTQSLADLHFPLWNSWNFSGYPFAGDIESMMFYPLLWPFAFIFQPFQSGDLVYFVILHYFIGSIFAYLLCYKFTKNIFASILGAIVFVYSGYALGHLSHLGQDMAYMWVPVVFLTFIIALEKKRLFYSLLSGFVFGLLILVGHFNTCEYVLLGLFLLTIYQFIFFKDRVKTAIFALIATVFAFTVSAILILPVYELGMQSNRNSLTYEKQSEGFSLNPYDLKGLVYPNSHNVLSEDPIKDFDGSVDITQNYLYVGIIPLIFALFFIFSKNKYKWFFVGFGLLTLFAAFGKYTPVNSFLFNYFPGFNKARMAVQIMGMVFFSLSVAVALGTEAVFTNLLKLSKKKFFKIIIAVFFVFLCLISGYFVLSNGYNKRFYSESVNPNTVFDSADDALVTNELSVDDEPFRIADELPVFAQNKWEYYGFENIWGNGGIKIKKYYDLFERTGPTEAKPINDNLFDFLNVKYVFTKRELPAEDFEKSNTDNFYLNRNSLPRAYFVNDYVVEKSPKKQLALIKNGEIDFANEVLLKEKPDYYGQIGRKEISAPSVDWDDKQPSYIKLKVATPSDSILVLSEVDYDGWNLKVDGEKEKYLTANYVFRAVPLKAGAHILEFEYRPMSVYFGALISLISFLFFAGTGAYLLIKNRKWKKS